MTDTALILAAAGSGSRFSDSAENRPKQFLNLMGKPLYMWSLLSFSLNKNVDQIVLVTREEFIDSMDATIQDQLFRVGLKDCYEKLNIIGGGSTRQESVYKGLCHLEKSPPKYVLVHDAARPYITQEQINCLVDAVKEYGAATLASQVTDTVKKVTQSFISETLDRNELFSAQTPQGALFEHLLRGHQKALEENFLVTDDASVIELLNEPVRIVQSSKTNLKITVKEDIAGSRTVAEEVLGQINELIGEKNNLNN